MSLKCQWTLRCDKPECVNSLGGITMQGLLANARAQGWGVKRGARGPHTCPTHRSATQRMLDDVPALKERIDTHIDTRLVEGMIAKHPLREVYSAERVDAFIATETARYADAPSRSTLLRLVHTRMNAEYFDHTLLYGSGPVDAIEGIPVR